MFSQACLGAQSRSRVSNTAPWRPNARLSKNVVNVSEVWRLQLSRRTVHVQVHSPHIAHAGIFTASALQTCQETCRAPSWARELCHSVMTKEPDPAICSCSLLFVVGLIGLMISGTGWGNNTRALDCNIRVRRDLISESFTAYPEKLLRATPAQPGFGLVPSWGVCSLEVSLSYGGADYNKTMSTLANSCTDLHDQDDADSVPLCFWNSPSVSAMRLARGWQTTFTSQQTNKSWKVATIVFGSITSFSVLMILLLVVLATQRGRPIAWWSRSRTVQPAARPLASDMADGSLHSSYELHACSTQP